MKVHRQINKPIPAMFSPVITAYSLTFLPSKVTTPESKIHPLQTSMEERRRTLVVKSGECPTSLVPDLIPSKCLLSATK